MNIDDHFALYTDYYQLTMAQAHFLQGREEHTATFNYFFRSLPFDGGYVLFAGLSEFLDLLRTLYFRDEHLEYLEGQGFKKSFLDFLSAFRFSGNIKAVREGEIVFPHEPLIETEGPIIELQLIETALLNLVNFQSLVATKGRRMRYAAGPRKTLEFGLRRAQGQGALQATRGALIGGVDATSNVLAAWQYGAQASGTMAHAWVQSFEMEIEAFRKYAETYPEDAVMLVDTYDTLNSGVPNAITVAKEMEQRGKKMTAVRLDSGDLARLSIETRKMLDRAGLQYVKILASNELDEYLIKSLQDQGAEIDAYGIGTRLVTSKDQPALGGVYKLIEHNGRPSIKLSENVVKISLPGKKRLVRYFDENDAFFADAILLQDENPVAIRQIYHPFYTDTIFDVAGRACEDLLKPVVQDGKFLPYESDVAACARYAGERFLNLPDPCKRFEFPQLYPVGLSRDLLDLRSMLIQQYRKQMNAG